MGCPDPQALSAFSRGGLDDDERVLVEAHLDYCETCSFVVSELVRVFTSQRHASADPSDDHSDAPPPLASADDPGRSAGNDETLADESVPSHRGPRLQPGRTLDRYHILQEVGSGGMGVVYAAYDPDLDRKVALKVLHDRSDGGNDHGQRRLTREAQAMARLSHPNVITVHEVRVLEQRVFISMEFVGGGTLGTWLAREQPSVPRILAMFGDIGRGLAAAHAAGLVHRDIKPDNVLIGEDGRPRVTDFGLARPADDTAEPSPARPSLAESVPQDAAPEPTMSRTKGLIGTPAYMSPEQLCHEPATVASDQFSYCVALYESLWGTRPFTGQTLMELVTNVLEGNFTEPAREPNIPRWLRQLVMRGLCREPADRWPSMSDLVERLDAGPRRTRRRLIAMGTLGLALVGGGLVANQVLSAPADPCAAGSEMIAALWPSTSRADLEHALSQGPSSYAEQNAALVLDRIDDYATQWSASHRQSCQSYHGGEQSDESFDLRSGCLAERRRELGALLTVLAQDKDEIRRHAVEAVDGLRPVATCADVEALRSQVAPPQDAVVATRVQQLDGDLARVRALLHAGQYEAGRALANEVTAAARTTGYSPILARALRERATAHDRRGHYEEAVADLREAWPLALGAGDDTLAADAVIALVKILGHSLAEYALADLRIADAEAMLRRVRRRDPRRADELSVLLWFAQGQIDLRHHRYDEAIAQFRRALELAERNTDAHSLRVASVLNANASARLARGDGEHALELYERVLQIRVRHLGLLHPETGHARNNVGLTLKNLHRIEAALVQLQQAQQILEASLDASHPSIQMVRLNLAEVLYWHRDYADAAELYGRVYGERPPEDLALPHTMRRYLHYAGSLSRSGQLERARHVLTLAHEQAHEDNAAVTLRTCAMELARVEVLAEHPKLALAHLDGIDLSLAIAVGTRAEMDFSRARALHLQGDDEAARQLLPKIVEALGEPGAPPRAEVEEFAKTVR